MKGKPSFIPPHPAQDQVFSVVVGPTQYRWALHDKQQYFPYVCWRTSAPTARECSGVLEPCELLSRYLPSDALDFVFGPIGAAPLEGSNLSKSSIKKGKRKRNDTDISNKRASKKRSVIYRATRPVPSISVYCIVPDEENSNDDDDDDENKKSNNEELNKEPPSTPIEFLRFMFGDIPCNLYCLRPNDIIGSDSNFMKHIPTDHLASLPAVDHLFPNRQCLIIDGGTPTLNFTAVAPKEADMDSKTPDSSQEGKMAASSSSLQKIVVLGISQTVSVTSKLRALHQYTSNLPAIDPKQLLNSFLDKDTAHTLFETGGSLFSTNTTDAMLACVAREVILLLRIMIQKWIQSKKLVDPNSTLPLVCITGCEAELIAKLLALPVSDNKNNNTKDTSKEKNSSEDCGDDGNNMEDINNKKEGSMNKDKEDSNCKKEDSSNKDKEDSKSKKEDGTAKNNSNKNKKDTNCKKDDSTKKDKEDSIMKKDSSKNKKDTDKKKDEEDIDNTSKEGLKNKEDIIEKDINNEASKINEDNNIHKDDSSTNKDTTTTKSNDSTNGVVLRWSSDKPAGMPNESQLLVVSGNDNTDTTAVLKIEVRTERHLVHQGVQHLLLQAPRDSTIPIRQELIGCRVANTFPQFSRKTIYRGQIVSIDSADKDDLDKDYFLVRYDDGDEEEYSIVRIHGKSKSFCCSSGVLLGFCPLEITFELIITSLHFYLQ